MRHMVHRSESYNVYAFFLYVNLTLAGGGLDEGERDGSSAEARSEVCTYVVACFNWRQCTSLACTADVDMLPTPNVLRSLTCVYHHGGVCRFNGAAGVAVAQDGTVFITDAVR